MELDRNFMGYYPSNNMQSGWQCPKYDNKGMNDKMDMPGYMYGKCMPQHNNSGWKFNPMNMQEYMQPGCGCRCNMNMHMHMNPEFHMHNMEPLENMCGKTYKVLIVYVDKTIQKMMMENMGVMPKAISKEKFKKEMNDMICEIMKREEEIKKIVVIDRNETDQEEEMDRSFCPFCHGMLKDTLSILFITELLRGGCTSCY